MRAHGISLWWIPDGEVHTRLVTSISQLADAHDAPCFEPHVTVIGQLSGTRDSVVDQAGALAAELAPFEVNLLGLGHEDVWTRWLFRLVAPTEPVMRANELARVRFGRTQDRTYTPHLSLLYGEFDETVTEGVMSGLPSPALSFSVDALHVVQTDGPVAEWGVLCTLPLGGPVYGNGGRVRPSGGR